MLFLTDRAVIGVLVHFSTIGWVDMCFGMSAGYPPQEGRPACWTQADQAGRRPQDTL